MAILSVRRLPGKGATINRDNLRTYNEKYLVKANVPDQSLTSIRIHPLIPKPWQPHREDPFAFADTPDINQQKNKYFFDVEVDYTTEIDEEEKPKNPLERPAEIDWTSQEFTRLAIVDERGRPILNTAGDPPEGGGLSVEDSFWVIAVEKNLAAVPRRIVTDNYASAVNQEAVRVDGISFEPNTLKLKRIRVSRKKKEEGIRFRTITFELHTRPETFTQTMLNRGFHQLVAFKALDDDGNEVEKTRREKVLVGGEDGRNGEPASEAVFLNPQGGYIEKPSRQIRFIDGGTEERVRPLPDDETRREAELRRRAAIIVLKWNVEKKRPFRGVIPLQ